METSNLQFKIVDHKSDAYWQLVDLRTLVLRKPLNLSFSKEELQNENNQTHFGCSFENLAIASLSLVELDQQTIKLRQVCTHPNYQGKSIGQQLSTFAENWAIENEYKYIECNARKVAVNFYKKMGYSIVSEMFYEVGLEHYKMKKEIF